MKKKKKNKEKQEEENDTTRGTKQLSCHDNQASVNRSLLRYAHFLAAPTKAKTSCGCTIVLSHLKISCNQCHHAASDVAKPFRQHFQKCSYRARQQ